MFLSALLLVSALQAPPTPVPFALGDQVIVGPTALDRSMKKVRAIRSMEEVRAIIKGPEACPKSGVELAANAEPATQAAVKMLGDLPPANHTLTVLRSVDGCPVSSTVRFNVDRPAGRR
ncbi:hypothetical protein ASD89_20180 [Caulobacter sp. Root656]|nr:hypothetical protein ASD89_20180 [Caulobacter sp. Root656]